MTARRDRCFVCGGGPHEPTDLHSFWSEADAWAEAVEHDRKVIAAGGPAYPSMSATETLDPREAASVASERV